jgi:hypothetical protein
VRIKTISTNSGAVGTAFICLKLYTGMIAVDSLYIMKNITCLAIATERTITQRNDWFVPTSVQGTLHVFW